MIAVRLSTMRTGAARLFQSEFACVSSSMTVGRNSAPAVASQASKDARAPVARRLATMAVAGEPRKAAPMCRPLNSAYPMAANGRPRYQMVFA